MKKFLSLALALVMTMSLVTISASATFTDDSSIEYTEAVDVMAAIDVIGGYTDGSFNPTGTLTRGAAAKIICNLMLGPTVAASLGTDTAPFLDVPVDHTFAGYIAYCAKEGIINGYTDDYFGPADTISGFAFMKMLLGALGYDPLQEGYTGTNWAVSVAAKAKVLGLDDGNDDYDGNAALTREEACLYALNTLTVECVEYPITGTTVTTTVGDATTSVTTGSYVANGTSLSFMGTYFTKLDIGDSTDDTEDVFGRPSTTWYYKGEKIGQYVDSSDLIATYEGKVTNATMYSLVGTSSSDGINTYVDGKTDTTYTDADLSDSIFTKNSSTEVADTGNGSYTEVYKQEDETGYIYTMVVINEYLVQATSDYSSSRESLYVDVKNTTDGMDYTISTTIYDEDVDVEDFEEDDYILVTVAWDANTKYDIQSAVLAEVVEGDVTSYTESDSVYIDGSKYSYNAFINTTGDNAKNVSFAVGETAALVLDSQGNVIYVDDATIGSKNFVFIDGFKYSSGLGGGTATAAAYFADGTYAEIEIDEVYNCDVTDGDSASTYYYLDIASTVTANAASDATSDTTPDGSGNYILAQNWFTYTTNSDGTYNLHDYNDTRAAKNAGEISGSTVNFVGSLKANSSTVFIIIDENDDIYTYTGVSNLPNVTGTPIATYAVKDATSGYVTYAFIDASTSGVVDDSSDMATDYFMVLPVNVKTSKDADDNTFYTYTVLVDGEAEEVYANSAYFGSAPKTNYTTQAGLMFNNLKLDSDGYINSYSDFDSEDEVVEYTVNNKAFTASGDVLSVNTGSDQYWLVGDATIHVVISSLGSGDAEDLMSDSGADYVIDTYYSASAVVNALDKYTVTGTVTVLFDDDASDTSTVTDMFIYIYDADDGV